MILLISVPIREDSFTLSYHYVLKVQKNSKDIIPSPYKAGVYIRLLEALGGFAENSFFLCILIPAESYFFQ